MTSNDHLQVMGTITGKFHQNPLETVGGVAETRLCLRKDGGRTHYYSPLRLTSRDNKGCLRLGLSWFNWRVSFAPEFQCCYFCEPSYLFHLSFNFNFYVSKIMHL